MASSSGILYIVATPIGNLGDITARALDVLQTVDLIACEDTRHSRKLMDHFHIKTTLAAYHEHSHQRSTDKMLEWLAQGKQVALISDAGTPLISDPGYQLVRQARQQGSKVVPIPGSCAAIAALSASGLPTDAFRFCGFLPAKSTARIKTLQQVAQEAATLVYYEAPHRIAETLVDMTDVFGSGREAVIARELSKTFETIHAAPLGELADWVQSDANQQRGEIVLMVEGCREKLQSDEAEQQRVMALLIAELPLKKAAALGAQITGGNKKALYNLGLALQGK